MNQALLCKWLWRCNIEEGSLWRQVVATTCGVGDGWNLLDAWCGEKPLILDFLGFFAIVADPKTIVATYMSALRGEIWQPILKQTVFN